jgi:hypothetical protein
VARKPDPADAMLTAVADFLKSIGWNVVVIGSPRIQKQPLDHEFNYEFVVRFTGAPPREEDGHVTASTATS